MRRTHTLALAFAISTSPAGLAVDEISVDSRVILSDLASLYREAPRAEDMRVTVENGADKRIERMTVRTAPGRGAEISLGPITLWTDLESWYATHEDLPGCYTRVPIEGRSVAETLDTHFPRLIVPQIAWMSSEGHVNDLCAYTTETKWETGTVVSPAAGPNADVVTVSTAIGRSAEFDVSVTMETTADHRDRLGVITLENAEGLSITAQRLEYRGPNRDAFGEPIEGREPVASFDALLARLPETGR